MQPTISIVTPSFNQGQYIEQTIDSVLSQGHGKIDYIIIDGGSTDNSVEIIKKYEKHLSYWVSEPDHGQSDAINKGLRHVKGDVVNWLNSDDYLAPGAFAYLSECFADLSINVVAGRSNIVQSGKILRRSPGTDVYSNNLPKTIGLARIDQPETYFRKSAVDKMGMLNPSLHYVMDKEWWLRYLFLFGLDGVKKTETILANFRLHENSKSVSIKSGFIDEGLALILELSLLAGNAKSSKLISSICAVERQNIMLPEIKDKELIKQSLNYALLYLADYYYYHNNDLELAKAFLKLVDPRMLPQSDKKWHVRLKTRLSLPPILIKSLKLFYR